MAFLAFKFVGRKTRENFLWFISIVSVMGIALGVVSLMLVIGVMNGFSQDLKRKILGTSPAVTVEGRPFIRDHRDVASRIQSEVPSVTGVSPYLASQVIFKSPHYILGGILRGVDPRQESEVTDIASFFTDGSMASLDSGIVLGSELAGELGVTTGDILWVLGGTVPRQRAFTVSGIVECGVYNYDVSMGLTSLANIQEFFGVGDVAHGLGMRTANIYRSEEIASAVRNVVDPEYEVSTWIQKNKILFAALALEKKAMGIILVLIVLVASFNIASTLMITVFRKTREIGVLKAIGVSSREIRRIFMYQGLILAGEGLVSGLIIGGILAFLLRKYRFIRLPELVYNLSRLPIEISIVDLAAICVAVIVLATIATFYPAYRAGKLDPAEALKYE